LTASPRPAFMTDTPFPTNQTATVVNQGIDGVFNVAVKAAEIAIVAEVPFLGNPILETIDNAIIEYIANKIYIQFAQWITFEIIDFQVGGEVSGAKTALIALKAAQKSGDKNAIIQALAAFDKATVKLTHFDGATSQ
jgi:hypothetical protein